MMMGRSKVFDWEEAYGVLESVEAVCPETIIGVVASGAAVRFREDGVVELRRGKSWYANDFLTAELEALPPDALMEAAQALGKSVHYQAGGRYDFREV